MYEWLPFSRYSFESDDKRKGWNNFVTLSSMVQKKVQTYLRHLKSESVFVSGYFFLRLQNSVILKGCSFLLSEYLLLLKFLLLHRLQKF